MRPLTARDGDAPVAIDLDTAWIGVNERDEAEALRTESGSYVASAINARFRGRKVETRAGWAPVAQFSAQDAGPDTLGTGLFVDAFSREWLVHLQWVSVLSLRALVLRVGSDGVEPKQLGGYIPESASLPEPQRMSLTQAEDEVVVWRGLDLPPLHWRAPAGFPLLWPEGQENTFVQAAPQSDAPGYAEYLSPLPAAEFGMYAAGRVVFPFADGIGYTDIAAPRRWDADLSRVPVGGAGRVTGLAWWRGRALLVFKERSVWALDGFTGDLADMSLTLLTDQAGCIAQATVTQVGGDVLFLGRGGVYRLTDVQDGGRQLSPLPVSWRIPKTMDRVNWSYAHLARATLADGLWYLALPLDGAAVCNALLVYDTVTEQWQGQDVIEGPLALAEITGLVTTQVFGRETPVLTGREVTAPGDARTLCGGHGWHDGLGSGDIRTEVVFRGYALEDAGLKTLRGLEVLTEELGTVVSLDARTAGQSPWQPVQSARTRSASRWMNFNHAARDLTNANDDAHAPLREDYTWTLSDNAMLKTGIPLGMRQRHKLGGMVRGVSVWVQPRVTCTRGRLTVHAVRASGTKARDWARPQ